MSRILLLALIFCFTCNVSATNVPIVGVLSQESFAINDFFPEEKFDSFIAASYVKFVESAGARVIPIRIGQSRDYYQKIVESTNGLLMPGGAVWFNQSNGFADAGQMLYDSSIEANKRGDYYPILGICLGMELLLQVALGGKEIRAHCNSKKVSLALEFVEGYETSKLYSKAPTHIIDILKSENVTVNYHQFCITEANMTSNNLDKDWRILSTNRDSKGVEFVSSFEHKKYPFYGLQFHPEKNPFEFKPSLNLYTEHTLNAVLASQYFGNHFVEETRKSGHKIDNWQDEQRQLIYNYAPKFSGILGSSYQQVYVFSNH